MKIINYGSLNLDYVYRVKDIVKPGETIDSYSVNHYPGGKGLNQTVALARAGARVCHGGMIGEDGLSLKKLLESEEVDCSYLKILPGHTGTAFIQVADNGQNSIVLNGGTNRMNTEELCKQALESFGQGDILLLQNEINLIDYLIDQAFEKGMYIVLNPSPITESLLHCNLHKVSMFLMNEIEGQCITGKEELEDILEEMRRKYPAADLVMTLGSEGAVYQGREGSLRQRAFSVQAVDTTAAGDTFTGYLLAAMAEGKPVAECLELASKAAAIAVTRMGATSSIPYLKEVVSFTL